MTQKSKSSLVFFSLLFLTASYFHSTKNLQKGDPDYFYHIALSRHMQKDAIPHQIPQIQGIGWNQDFTDKEFLFHQFSSKLFSFGGEEAVQYLPLFLLFVTLSLIWLGLPSKIKVFQKGLILVGIVSSPYWIGRVVMVRPHTLAIPLVLSLFIALNRKKKWLSGISAALFSMSYHAFQVPLALLGLFAGLHWFSGSLLKRKEEKETLLYGGVGLGLGLIFNPYFPGVLFVGLQHLKIALKMTQGGDLPYGFELYPWVSSQLLIGNLLFIFVLSLAIIFQQIRSFSFLTCLLFWGLACLSPRALEYAIPLTGLLLGELFLTSAFKNRVIQVGFASVLLFQGYGFVFAWKDRQSLHRQWDPKSLPFLEAARVLPQDETNVFNCSWDISPFLFYSRPNSKFLDILDPSFLFQASRESHDLRDQLVSGMIGNPYGVLKDFFQVKYVFCQSPSLVGQMESDPRFVRRFPVQTPEGSAFVYELVEEPNAHFVNHYEMIPVPQGAQARILKAPPSEGWEDVKKDLSYLDLKKWFLSQEKSDEKSKKSISCFWIRPKIPENLVGSTYFGIGGSPNLRVWVNKRPLYQNVGEFTHLKAIDTLIPLSHPIVQEDKLELLVCGKKRGGLFRSKSFFLD